MMQGLMTSAPQWLSQGRTLLRGTMGLKLLFYMLTMTLCILVGFYFTLFFNLIYQLNFSYPISCNYFSDYLLSIF